MKKLLAIAVSVLLFSACSGAPSESDIKKTLEEYVAQKLSTTPKGIPMKIEIKDIDDVSCKKVCDDIFSCTYTTTIEITSPQFYSKALATISQVTTTKKIMSGKKKVMCLCLCSKLTKLKQVMRRALSY